MWFFLPSKEEIKSWVESKEKEFVEKENINPRLSVEDWLQRYIFTDLHEIFFGTFPSELHAWLSRLEESETKTHSNRPTEWTSKVIQRLEWTDKSISHVVDFWLNNLLEGFDIEFAMDMLKAYNEVERYFLKGYYGKYLNSLNLWIKMLLCEQGILRLDA